MGSMKRNRKVANSWSGPVKPGAATVISPDAAR